MLYISYLSRLVKQLTAIFNCVRAYFGVLVVNRARNMPRKLTENFSYFRVRAKISETIVAVLLFGSAKSAEGSASHDCHSSCYKRD